MSLDLEPLFTPWTFKGVTFPNRWAMAPMTRSFCPEGIPGEDVADYYRRRVEGGIGLILTEGVVIDHPASSGYPRCPNLHDPRAQAGWRRVVAAVHAAGGKIMPQIWHVGLARQPGMEPDPTVPGCGPSSVALIHGQHPGVALSVAEIHQVIAAYADAACHAQACGFDGVEIHGAHGYLIDQFLWEFTNRREDEYGGSLENRLRFAVEVVEAVRRAVGPEFIVCFRFSQWKPTDFSARLAPDPATLERLLLPLSQAGVDLFHASNRRYWEAEFPGSDWNLAGWTQKITGKPAITVGSIGLDDVRWSGANATGVDELIRRFNNGEFVLAAVGRILLSDPQWANKMRRGALDEVIPYTKEALTRLM
ncbi:MAG: NADH:flavin oxidoreductase [Magnetococcales bacterium]|nr:NADH:flavin oxidoreductase [Magnetococcales bacterium]